MASFQLSRILEQPAVVDREDVIRVPNLVRLVEIHDMLHFRGAVEIAAAAMRVAKDGMGTPFALVRATARSDQVDAAHAVMRAPDIHILAEVDLLAVGPGQAVNVGDLLTLHVADERAFLIAENGAGDAVQPVRPMLRQSRQQLGQGHLAFADDHHIRAVGDVLVRIIGRFRPAADNRPVVALGFADDPDHIAARDQVGVDAQHAAGSLRQPRGQLSLAAEGGVKNLHGKAGAAQIGRIVQQPQGGVGLHDLAFFFILHQEVAVG